MFSASWASIWGESALAGLESFWAKSDVAEKTECRQENYCQNIQNQTVCQ